MTLALAESALSGCATLPVAASSPLLGAWSTPFGIPPFADIRPGAFKPAIEAAIAEHDREIAAIAADTAPVSFDSVIAAMERSGATLNRVSSVFFNLTGMHTNPQLQAVEGDIAQMMSAHGTSIYQNSALFARIDALHGMRASLELTAPQRRLLERTWAQFARGGALLNGADKARVGAIDARLAALQVQFGQNVLAGQSGFGLALRTEADFAGLPEGLAAEARAAARERGSDAMGLITLSRSSFEPFLTFSARRDLREAVQRGWMAVGSTGSADNRPLVKEILDLRTEKARLLGFPSFAAYQLDDKMARTPQAAMEMMQGVWAASLATARRERAMLQEQAASEGMREPLQSWDWWHYAEKVRKARFDIDETETRPYFELSMMIDAIHWNANRLFGLRFVRRTDLPVWHPDVVAYEVFDRDDRHVAIWFGDFYTRTSKQSGAWMSSLRDQQKLAGDITPLILNVCNYVKPEAGQPTLLGFDDVVTLFHEFGHALHGMLSDVIYPSQSGTSVLRDFVEFPSQLMEHWAIAPEILNRFAVHHETAERLPPELVDRLLAAKNFNQGWATTEYLSAAMMDMRMHMIEGPAPSDIDAWERQLLEGMGLIPEIVVRYRPGYFKHTFEGGYAAGYYSYIWAAVLECDAFNAFTEARDFYDPETAERLRRTIFSSGDTMAPMDAFVAFRGRPPRPDALLEARGLSV